MAANKDTTTYGKIKVGAKTLNDATLNLGALKSFNAECGDKNTILKALASNDIATLRKISRYFYLFI